jgi:hypothetical protein
MRVTITAFAKKWQGADNMMRPVIAVVLALVFTSRAFAQAECLQATQEVTELLREAMAYDQQVSMEDDAIEKCSLMEDELDRYEKIRDLDRICNPTGVIITEGNIRQIRKRLSACQKPDQDDD